MKKELGDSINEENQRINVDSAKKKAVMYHMDYDNFHQMVLGANLKTIKKGSVENIFRKQSDTPLNSLATQRIINGEGYDEDAVKGFLQIKLEESLQAPNSPQEFEKFFTKKIQEPMQRYTYMRLMPLEHYRSIFIGDFDSELLIKIFLTFNQVVIQNEGFNNETEQAFIHDFLTVVAGTPNFDFSLEFLGKKEMDVIALVINGLGQVPEESRIILAKKFKV